MKQESLRLASGILNTDFYQLTMAQVYFHQGLHERPARFEHFFRHYPDYGKHKAGYCVQAGMEWLLDWMETARFGEEELAHLRALEGRQGRRLFDDDFLDWLGAHGDFSDLVLHSIPEGRVVHADTPLTVVEGPLAMAQILETTLLMSCNYPILIATKAAAIHQAGGGNLLLEFGTRRAHERAAWAGIRAALIGGADYSSNTGISLALGVDPKGTHAHSLVQAFLGLGHTEEDAFRAYARSFPDDCILLVDTVDTLRSGVPAAIRVFAELREQGHEPQGIRLDSGDLAYLAVRSAKMLDEAGFPQVKIVLSNQLDELVLLQIRTQIRTEAPHHGLDPEATLDRLVYGVGTALITSAGDAALDGVYKLTAIEDEAGRWQPAIKLSESHRKIPTPGRKCLWRLYDGEGHAVVDLLATFDEEFAPSRAVNTHDVHEPGISSLYPEGAISRSESLLEKVWDGGRQGAPASLKEMRERRRADLDALHPGVKRILNPHRYHVSLSDGLHALKRQVLAGLRGDASP
ncbi:MAG: nicotinate phosphoribosyltransferase [Gemmatimonadales bacterium]|nr:nicotinate phosphoribosyltransferase [Thioalkalivibrio sp.]